MDPARFTRVDATTWRIEPHGAMRVPAIIYADENLIRDMDDKVYEQAVNVATLPGIVQASYAMPDAHWGYGFPIGGVAAFDPDAGRRRLGGRRRLRHFLRRAHHADRAHGRPTFCPSRSRLPIRCFARSRPASAARARSRSMPIEMDAMLTGGARWAVERGWGEARDLERIEEQGRMAGAEPDCVSERAKERQRREMGTLGSGNHYLEVQAVAEIFDANVAEVFGLAQDDVVVTIHCGSRGLGHQIGTEFLKEMVVVGGSLGHRRCPIASLPARRSIRRSASAISAPCARGINCALANREILGHYARRIFGHFFPDRDLRLLFDVSHNTCKVETARR